MRLWGAPELKDCPRVIREQRVKRQELRLQGPDRTRFENKCMPPKEQDAATTADAEEPNGDNLAGTKRKRKRNCAPAARVEQLPTLTTEMANVPVVVNSANAMMSKEQRLIHQQKKAHFASATKKLQASGSGAIRVQWKKQISLFTNPSIPYRPNMSAAEVMKCLNEEKGTASVTPPNAPPTPPPPGAQISGLRYL